MTDALHTIAATTFDGVTLPVDVRGSGPTVVFINGLTQTTAHWRTQLRLFAEAGFRAAAYDGRGQGDVPAPLELNRDHHARDLCAVQDALGVSRCHVVGFSHGSRVAIAHALRFPERVEKLVLVGCSGGLNARGRLVVQGWRDVLATMGPETLALQSLPWILSDAYIEAHQDEIPLMVRAHVRRNKREGTLAMLDGLLRDPGTVDELDGISLPTLFLAGDQDRFAPPSHHESLAKRVKGARVTIIPNAGHTVAIETPDRFRDAVVEFLRSDLHA